MSSVRSAYLPDAGATETLAADLASTAPAGAVVHLHGDLGTGKTTIARAWLRGLGVSGPVKSPTYTLVERYPLAAGGEVLHLDLYRIGNAGELEFLGLDDADARLWLVEWPERGAGALPAPDLEVALEVLDEGRACLLRFRGSTGDDWAAAFDRERRLRGLPEP
ncbi:MAG: tRNA (adenosine(37)-N6)-threonylcarbamoyltransferase complex ATPase subunit type 1 TsaE [Gammaproteobacteria bacterium]|jgi:tRNA threonylcarbamoyladenosine biosynthesis protein TsaE|nr:tRNA (adenosine(37)-N6)-threonylcarbamoyltransferase complex ATPase subunit type 1 TsaE [Gammaproteobacteria bacterium]